MLGHILKTRSEDVHTVFLRDFPTMPFLKNKLASFASPYRKLKRLFSKANINSLVEILVLNLTKWW